MEYKIEAACLRVWACLRLCMLSGELRLWVLLRLIGIQSPDLRNFKMKGREGENKNPSRHSRLLIPWEFLIYLDKLLVNVL
jgi:hypothetical protein